MNGKQWGQMCLGKSDQNIFLNDQIYFEKHLPMTNYFYAIEDMAERCQNVVLVQITSG
jgi:hypothetical protein